MLSMKSFSFLVTIYVLRFVIGLETKYENIHGRLICFYSNQACERGTETAMLNYAIYAEKILGMKSRIIFPKFIETSNPISDVDGRRLALPLFQNRFNVSFCGPSYDESMIEQFNMKTIEICPDLTNHAYRIGCEVLYINKHGRKSFNPIYPLSFTGEIPTAVHAVFKFEPHGTTYGALSTTVSGNRNAWAVVPNMLIPPTEIALKNAVSMRSELNISENALVFCAHGGTNSYDNKEVHRAIYNISSRFGSEKVAFIYMGLSPWKNPKFLEGCINHFTSVFIKRNESVDQYSDKVNELCPKAIEKQHFLSTNTDMSYKENYFKTCDLMLHGRSEGETFGLSVGEFSIRNKPVICQDPMVSRKSYDPAHVNSLGNQAILFYGYENLIHIMEKLIIEGLPKNGTYNAYSKYTPELVMDIFKDVFLDPIFKSNLTVTNNLTHPFTHQLLSEMVVPETRGSDLSHHNSSSVGVVSNSHMERENDHDNSGSNVNNISALNTQKLKVSSSKLPNTIHKVNSGEVHHLGKITERRVPAQLAAARGSRVYKYKPY